MQQVWSLRQLSAWTDLSVRTLARHTITGKIPAPDVKCGRCSFYSDEQFTEIVNYYRFKNKKAECAVKMKCTDGAGCEYVIAHTGKTFYVSRPNPTARKYSVTTDTVQTGLLHGRTAVARWIKDYCEQMPDSVGDDAPEVQVNGIENVTDWSEAPEDQEHAQGDDDDKEELVFSSMDWDEARHYVDLEEDEFDAKQQYCLENDNESMQLAARIEKIADEISSLEDDLEDAKSNYFCHIEEFNLPVQAIIPELAQCSPERLAEIRQLLQQQA